MAVLSKGVPNMLTPGQIASLVKMPTGGVGSGGMSDTDAAVAVAIALAESGGNANAFNGVPPDESYGLWQINMLGSLGDARRTEFKIKDNKELFNPLTNYVAMTKVKASSGWGAWSVYKNGRYRAYLTKAQNAVANPEKVPLDHAPYPEDVNVMDPVKKVFELLMQVFGPLVIRIAAFVGGGVILILGIVLYARSQGVGSLKGLVGKG